MDVTLRSINPATPGAELLQVTSIEIAKGDKQADGLSQKKEEKNNCWQVALQATAENMGVDYGFRGTLGTIGRLSCISLCNLDLAFFSSAKSSSNLA